MPLSERDDVGTFALVLAGGSGQRLMPLTSDRAKPAVPFAGSYRIIDFALSNLVNAGQRKIAVLTQYKSHSLDRHIAQTWRLSPLLGNYVTTVPAQMRRGPQWFAGSADAIYQNLNLIYDERPANVIVFSADHIYRMDPTQMVEAHIAAGAGVTVGTIRVPRSTARDFGIVEVDERGVIHSFLEKPVTPPPGLADSPDETLASMGNYVFTTETLVEAVTADAEDPESAHDLGSNVIPRLVRQGLAHAYDFATNAVPGSTPRDHGYWRDVGSIDAYFEAHMDLVSTHPVFNLYNRLWPIHSSHRSVPPAKFVLDDDDRRGYAVDSMVSAGAIISGSRVRRSIISPDVVVHSFATVERSVLLDGVNVGRGSVIRRAIIDKGVDIPPGTQIGVDPDEDRRRFTVSPNGIVVIGKRERVNPPVEAG
ncbi:MAG: glucose-1-phosphate adenylyltransferase [Candidatus Dormibacteria bacterium]